jgi:hypothetical protein
LKAKRLNFPGHEESSEKLESTFKAKTNQATKIFRVFKNAHLMLTFEDIEFQMLHLHLLYLGKKDFQTHCKTLLRLDCLWQRDEKLGIRNLDLK